MHAHYPSSSTKPRSFIKTHQVLAAMAAATLATAAVAISVGAWQLTDGSDDGGRAPVRAPEFNFDRVAINSTSPSIPVATFDELVAMHEALTAPQFGTIAPSEAVAPTEVRIATFDELVAMHEALMYAQFGDVAAPAAVVPTASTDELLAIHEALIDAQTLVQPSGVAVPSAAIDELLAIHEALMAAQADDGSSDAGTSGRLPGEGGRGHVTIE